MCHVVAAVVSWGSSKVVLFRPRRRKLQRAVLPGQSWVGMSGAAGAVCAGEFALADCTGIGPVPDDDFEEPDGQQVFFRLQRMRKLQQIGSVMTGMLIGLHPPKAPCHCVALLMRFSWRRRMAAKSPCDNSTRGALWKERRPRSGFACRRRVPRLATVPLPKMLPRRLWTRRCKQSWTHGCKKPQRTGALSGCPLGYIVQRPLSCREKRLTWPRRRGASSSGDT